MAKKYHGYNMKFGANQMLDILQYTSVVYPFETKNGYTTDNKLKS